MEQEKRRPIRMQILRSVIMISAMSLIITSLFGIISMFQIQKDAERALTDQAKDNLSTLLEAKVNHSNLRIGRITGFVSQLAYCIDDIIAHPEKYASREIAPTTASKAGEYVIRPILESEDIIWEEHAEEAGRLANIDTVMYPIMSENSMTIMTTYFGLENGLAMLYDNLSDINGEGININDYKNSLWYELGKKGEAAFTDVYHDHYGRGLTITCVAPLHDKNGEFFGVIGMDLLINDLYNEIIDIDLGEEASMFILGSSGNVISLDPADMEIDTETADGRLRDSDKARMGSFPDGITVRDGRYYAFNTIESVGWKLCVSVPQSNVLELANKIGQNIVSSIIMFILFFLIILVSVIIVAVELSGRITAPITTLTNDVRKMSGDLDYRATVTGNDEVSDLAVQFNEMAESLKERISALTAINAEKERMRAELDIAAKIQESTLPKDFPDSADFGVYATMTPAKEVGGDFYDFFTIDSDHFALVMADVSGKGIPAALFMTIAKSAIHNSVLNGGTTGEVMTRVNNILNRNNNSGFFVTVWLGIVTISNGELQFSSAGHEYPAICHSSGQYELLVTDNLPALAVQEDIEYDCKTITLEKGASIFLYTDGVPDAKRADGERFGTKRMLEVLNSSSFCDMKQEISLVKAKISEFTGDTEPFDDITMLGFTRR
ncbi:MAG: SpoIIE family protein phosphatase [Ruminiclostridium sp.]|nr:SpoIIE family protein phosphatase [Ruminiclostridium sp.]